MLNIKMSRSKNDGGSKTFPGCTGSHKGRKYLFSPGACSINLPSPAILGMELLHQIMIVQALLTAAGAALQLLLSCFSSMLCRGAGFPSTAGCRPQGNQSIWEARGAVRVKGEPKILLMALSQNSLKPAFPGSCGAVTANLNSASSGH